MPLFTSLPQSGQLFILLSGSDTCKLEIFVSLVALWATICAGRAFSSCCGARPRGLAHFAGVRIFTQNSRYFRCSWWMGSANYWGKDCCLIRSCSASQGPSFSHWGPRGAAVSQKIFSLIASSLPSASFICLLISSHLLLSFVFLVFSFLFKQYKHESTVS